MTERIEKMAVELLEAIREEKKVQKVERGITVTVAGHEWIVLKVEDNKVYCLHKEIMDSKEFDEESNNWSESDLREYLNRTFLDEILKDVNKSNMYEITSDLLSLDGQTEYGNSSEHVSLLTVDLYRENRDILQNENEWWWLCTPWSTKCNGYEYAVCCVSALGYIGDDYCDGRDAGRPFCIFDSNIFES